MIDISFIGKIPYIGYIYLGIVALVTILTIIINTSHGIIRDLFKVGYYIILYFMFKYLYPLGQQYLGGVAFLASKPTLLMALIAIIIIIVWLLIRKIFYVLFKKLFKKERKASKFFGFLFSLPVALLFNVLLVNVADPYLFAGNTAISSDPYVQIYTEMVMSPIQDAAFTVNVPTSLESILANKAFEDKDAQNKAYQDLKNVKHYFVNGSAYLSTVEDQSEFIKSYITVLGIVNGFNNEKLKTTVSAYTTNFINDCEGQTIHLGEYKSVFEQSIVDVGISAEALLKAQSIFVE